LEMIEASEDSGMVLAEVAVVDMIV
jgi:hypothetical protein